PRQTCLSRQPRGWRSSPVAGLRFSPEGAEHEGTGAQAALFGRLLSGRSFPHQVQIEKRGRSLCVPWKRKSIRAHFSVCSGTQGKSNAERKIVNHGCGQARLRRPFAAQKVEGLEATYRDPRFTGCTILRPSTLLPRVVISGLATTRPEPVRTLSCA